MRKAALLGLAALTAWAQPGSERAKKTIDDALAAMGGPAYQAMRDRVETGRGYAFAHDNLSGLARLKIYTRYLVRPEPPQSGFVGQRERQAQGKDEDVSMVFAEKDGFEITFRGAKPLPAAVIDRWREGLLHSILYILRMRLGEPGLVVEWKGTEVFDNQPVNVVNIVDADNRQVEVMFHQSTKLPVRQEWAHRDEKTKYVLREVTVFTKWRDVGGGVMWPFTLRRERNGERVSEIYAESVVINQGLTDDLFTISGATKVIEKKK